ncbi:thioredoxin [Thalassotalea piscium]
MKNRVKILLVVLGLTVSSCACFGGQKHVKPAMAIGDVSSEQLLSNYIEFGDEYERFSTSDAELAIVKTWPKNLKIEAFFGSWCHDSEREVPRLIKSLDNKVNLQLIGLDYLKSEPLGRALKANVQFTPTFVLYLDNKEIGRIIERPEVSLVADIDSLIKKEAN